MRTLTLIKPYDYQQIGIDKLTADRGTGNRRQSLTMATGLGKTYTALLALKEWLVTQSGRIGVFCHQTDILDQWERAFRAIFGNSLSYGRYHGSVPKAPDAQVVLCSFQSMVRGRESFDPTHFGYTFVDESQHGPAPTYRPTIEHFAPYSHLLGLTATPNRADGQSIAEIFGKPVYELPLEVALARGYLARVQYMLLSDGIQNLDKLPTNLGTMSVKALNRLFFAPERDERIVELIAEHTAHLGDALRMMVFCKNIAHAQRYEQLLPNAWAVHSRLKPHWQDRRIQDFREGRRKTIAVVDKFNEGVDFPEANAGALLREHGSEMGFLQQVGRLLRPDDSKEKVVILDIAGNCERLEYVAGLYRRVRTIYDELNPSQPTTHLPKPFEATVGEFEFDVSVRKVLDVLAAVRGGYTREALKEQLLAKAVDGIMPSIVSIESDPNMASHTTFRRAFGNNWAGIAEEVGLKYIGPTEEIKSYTKAELAQQLRNKAKDGVMPSTIEVAADPDMATYLTYQKRFGKNWAGIAEELGLKYTEPVAKSYTKAELTRQLLSKAKDGVMPSTTEVDADPNMASRKRFREAFGKPWPGIAAELGLKPFSKKRAQSPRVPEGD
ncbi:MAG TPA: DEAD/DEAH box helicase [Candidatus Saccharimonadales bacterium]|nr:DEAD/DEAH box helicase [Candidatus Saccharimonadales bacterium]